jgi:hypothetical protein
LPDISAKVCQNVLCTLTQTIPNLENEATLGIANLILFLSGTAYSFCLLLQDLFIAKPLFKLTCTAITPNATIYSNKKESIS